MKNQRMPALFLGHGSPEWVLGNNPYVEKWKVLGETLGKPKAILAISAHWVTRGYTAVTGDLEPKTIHDFGGFPPKMYELHYGASGSPQLAAEIIEKLSPYDVRVDNEWGFDHGTWCILYHMYPDADVPVIQLSLDLSQPMQWHYDLGRQLKWLREEGVLILGSGNIVHNLGMMSFPESSVHKWASNFDTTVKNCIERGDFQSLIDYKLLGDEALKSVPTEEHYLPLLYILGLKEEDDHISFPIEGLAYGSLSMRSVILG